MIIIRGSAKGLLEGNNKLSSSSLVSDQWLLCPMQREVWNNI